MKIFSDVNGLALVDLGRGGGQLLLLFLIVIPGFIKLTRA